MGLLSRTSGSSTLKLLLRIVVGLDRVFEGSVRLPAHGKTGVVFQEPRLLPWRTVEENVMLAAPQGSDVTLSALFVTLGLAEHRRHYPSELSLGIARRVALARAFAIKPDLLVLDEPFVSLDTALAARVRTELIELVSRQPVTTLLVTHSKKQSKSPIGSCCFRGHPRACLPTCGSNTRAAYVQGKKLSLSATRCAHKINVADRPP